MSEEEKKQTKPAEMSFSDWKKMKSAQNSGEEKKSLHEPNSKVKLSNANFPKTTNRKHQQKHNNNLRQNFSNNVPDYRNQQSLQYFESLKQNHQRVFNMGMFMMPAVNNIRQNNNCWPFGNNMGAFNNNNVNSMDNMRSYRNDYMMNTFKNNNMQNMNQNIPRNQKPVNGFNLNNDFTENRLSSNEEFFNLAEKPIPQNLSNSRNSNSPVPLMSIQTSMDMRFNVHNRKRKFKKPNDNEPKNASASEPAKETPTAPSQKKSKAQQKKIRHEKPIMPPPMLALTPEEHELKQRMWREYRQKMKPFKNRDFLNAKRVIQRLKKIKYEELDEKDKERLDKATEFVNSHKKMLTDRAIARGEAATARAALVQNSLNAEKASNVPMSTAKISLNDIKTIESGQNVYEKLCNSFIPGGVLFNTTTTC